ncbi:mycofactocin precursor MftA [Nocardia sp. NPDC059246]
MNESEIRTVDNNTETIADDLLVEDVSIDGMCGVY